MSIKLLLAEDERSLSRALTAILERNNYSVDLVYDGEEHWPIWRPVCADWSVQQNL